MWSNPWQDRPVCCCVRLCCVAVCCLFVPLAGSSSLLSSLLDKLLCGRTLDRVVQSSVSNFTSCFVSNFTSSFVSNFTSCLVPSVKVGSTPIFWVSHCVKLGSNLFRFTPCIERCNCVKGGVTPTGSPFSSIGSVGATLLFGSPLWISPAICQVCCVEGYFLAQQIHLSSGAPKLFVPSSGEPSSGSPKHTVTSSGEPSSGSPKHTVTSLGESSLGSPVLGC